MKIKFFSLLSIILVIVLSLCAVQPASVAKSDFIDSGREEKNVVTVANINGTSAEYDKVLEARFLNMLNHNFVYDDDFKSLEEIINNSVFALLDLRDSEDESYISEVYVRDYVFNMYGIEIENFEGINSGFDQKEGYVYILPRGYSVFNHEISSVKVNEDGSYTVKTIISQSSHDGDGIIDTCETLFVKNDKSQFGYSIIKSVIGAERQCI